MIYKQEDICCKSYGYELWKMSAYRLKYIFDVNCAKSRLSYLYMCDLQTMYERMIKTYTDDNIYV